MKKTENWLDHKKHKGILEICCPSCLKREIRGIEIEIDCLETRIISLKEHKAKYELMLRDCVVNNRDLQQKGKGH